MRKARRLFALTIATVVALSACSPQAAPSPSPSASVVGVTPQNGGTLVFAVHAEPASYDPHRETDPVVLELVAPHYSLLYRTDPSRPAEILPDVAQGQPVFSSDNLTVTVKLRTDVKFHDGAPLTSADVVATYQKIVAPADGVVSARRADYAMVDSVSAPDAATVVFKLKRPSAGFKVLLASPWNVIESAAKLKADPHWYEKNVDGTGPFIHVSNVPGQDWVARKNPDYFAIDTNGARLPYLDGYKALIIPDAGARLDAVAKKTALVDFHGFAPAQVTTIVSALGDDAGLQQGSLNCVNDLLLNRERSPLTDVKVRQAVSLGMNRYGASSDLQKTTPLHDVGAFMRPNGRFALTSTDLQTLKGFGTDAAKNKTDAAQLLKDAGVSAPSLTLLAPDTAMPYDALTSTLVAQWKDAGITVKLDRRAPAAYADALRARSYDLALTLSCAALDEPDLQLGRFRGMFGDTKLDDMIDAQSKELDAANRDKLVAQTQKYLMDEQAYAYPVLWWARAVPYARELRGWRLQPGEGVGQDLATVWIAR